jgi:hypothetical protein
VAENEGAGTTPAPADRCTDLFETGAEILRCAKERDHPGAHVAEGRLSDTDDGTLYAISWWQETDEPPDAPDGL